MLSKKIIAFTFSVFAAFLLGQSSLLAQSKKSISNYSAPSRLMLKGDDKEVAEAENGDLLREKFYPIGWSKDGKFAFYLEPADEACGCYFAELIIQDMRTDKILWQRSYNSEENAEETLKDYWKKNQKEFSRKLARYGIKAENQFELLSSSIEYQKDILTPEFEDNTSLDEEGAVKGNVSLRLNSKDKGKKTLYEKTYSEKDYDSFRGAEISGILRSPFEPRAAIIIVETHRGYEGPPNITRIRIVGTNLTTGFR